MSCSPSCVRTIWLSLLCLVALGLLGCTTPMRTVSTKSTYPTRTSHSAKVPPSPKRVSASIYSKTKVSVASRKKPLIRRAKVLAPRAVVARKPALRVVARRVAPRRPAAKKRVVYPKPAYQASWFMPPPRRVSWFVPHKTPYPTIPMPKHKSFKWIVRRFRTAKWGFTATILKRRGLYRDIVMRELKRMRLPLGLIVLAGIESNYTPRLVSPTGAMGMWQFIDRTGKEVGLKRTPWVDERRDLVKSTRAALKYVSYLHQLFEGDWGKAIAAYNCGPGCIRAAMKRCKGKSIWWMRLRGCGVSREARNYVARFFALVYFMKHPPNGWKAFPSVDPVRFATVRTRRATSLIALAKSTGISLRTLYEYNPELSSWMTPPRTRYPLKVPVKSVAKVRRFLRKPGQQVRWKSIRLRKDQSLTQVSREYRVPRQVLRYVNRTWGLWTMKNRRFLVVPLPRKGKRWPKRLKRKHRKVLYGLLKSSRRHGWRFPAYFRYHSRQRYISHKKKLPCYRARKGDTFKHIALRFKVSVSRLKRRNQHITRLRKGSRIRVFAASQCYFAPPQRPFRMPLAN